jgi:hypothetical protein
MAAVIATFMAMDAMEHFSACAMANDRLCELAS